MSLVWMSEKKIIDIPGEYRNETVIIKKLNFYKISKYDHGKYICCNQNDPLDCKNIFIIVQGN